MHMEVKKQYTVRLMVMAPVELIYKVWAESPEEAMKTYEKSPLSRAPKPILASKRKQKATVYKLGTTMVELEKKY